ncbi:MAG: hypothetical protein ACKN81_02370, partial [Pirellulaceae bacterium]
PVLASAIPGTNNPQKNPAASAVRAKTNTQQRVDEKITSDRRVANRFAIASAFMTLTKGTGAKI